MSPERRAGPKYTGNSPSHTALQWLISNSHVTLVGVDPVEQGLRCHPLHRQPALQAARGRVRVAPNGTGRGREGHVQGEL